MQNLTQEQLTQAALNFNKDLLDRNDIYALGTITGWLNLANNLGYELTDKDLKETNEEIANLIDIAGGGKATTQLVVSTNRLDISINISYDKETLIFTADGIEFLCEKTGDLQWCTDISVLDDSTEFESICFFYNDWLDDVLETMTTLYDVAPESVKYTLFSNCIADKLVLD